MNGLPAGQLPRRRRRGSRSASRTRRAAHPAVLYAGLRLDDNRDGSHHVAEVFKSTNGGASWTADRHRRPTTARQRRGLLRHAVLLRQRDRGRPDQPEHRLRRSARSATTSARSRAASSARPTAARPGRTSAATCIRTSTPLAFDPTNTSHVADRQRRRRLVQPRTAVAAPTPADPLDRGRLAGPQRHRRPEHGGRAASHRPATITQFTSIATVPTVPGRFWGGTQDNGTLRKSVEPAAAGSTWRAVTAARCSSTRPNAELRLRHVLRHLELARTASPTAATRSSPTSHPRRHQPERPVGVLRPVGHEPGQPEPAVPRHVPAVPHRQRRGDDAGDVTGTPISPDLTTRLHRHGPERRPRLRDLGDRRAGGGDARRTPAPSTGSSGSARTRVTSRHARPGSRSTQEHSCRTGPCRTIAVDRSN